MKILVIGRTERVRTKVVDRLRNDGHNAIAVPPRRLVYERTAAPTDPGYAGRHLRKFLEGIAAVMRDQLDKLNASRARGKLSSRVKVPAETKAQATEVARSWPAATTLQERAEPTKQGMRLIDKRS